MRIAYVTETWLPATDGIITRLSETITRLRAAGHEILVIAPADPGRTDPGWPGVQVRTVPTVGWRFLYGGKRWGLPLPRVGRYLAEFAPDVVHVVNPVLLGSAGVRAARGRDLPLVASYHTDVARYARCYRLGWLTPVIWARLRRLHGQAAINLATSAASVSDLDEHGIAGVRLWPRGADLERFRPDPGRPANPRPVALYVGRLAAEKGLTALAPLAAPDSGVELVLVGDGPARDELAATVPARYTGSLSGAALTGAYQRADVFVFPSTTDTLGLVLLEALASGLPVVAMDSPASRETLAGCPAARLCPADAPERFPLLVEEILAAAPRAELARAARAHARQWSWDTATAALSDCYREAAGVPASVGAAA
jgi:glycosyltransferase involved in cell wall biosynthesis